MRARNMFSTSAKNQLSRPARLGVFKSESKAAFGTTSAKGGAYVLGGEYQKDQNQSHPGKLSPANLTVNADYSIFKSQQNNETLSKVKDELIRFIKQEDQLISFNSSSPRFKGEATHQIRVLAGKDSISGINFRLKQDQQLGPGSYQSATEIEERQRQKRAQPQPGVFFGSSIPRA